VAFTPAFQTNAFQSGAFQVLRDYWMLTDIIDRFQAVLEAAPFSLKATTDPFGLDRQPNAALNNAYRIEDSGLVRSHSITNHVAARVDRLTVFIARKVAFGGSASPEALEAQLITIERYLKTDGRQNGFHVEAVGRKMKASKEVVIGSIDLTVDYDFNEAVS
jgi:hypothetical protein